VSTADPMSHSLFQQQWPEGEYRMFQLGFLVDDLLAAARRWVDVFGVGPFHIMPRVSNACHYRGGEGSEDFGFFTEVAEETASFQANLSRISQTCAEWDGSDPIRILTRDGYRTP